MTTTRRVGILDSGVGGLSIVRAVRRFMPDVDLVYYADTAHFPYGEKSEAEIRQLVRAGIERLRAEGCDPIILACNTASTLSLHDYADDAAGVKILGVTPLVDAAAAATRTGKIIVLATFATLASQYYRQIQRRLDDGKLSIYTQACFDWVRLVESGRLDDDGLIAEQIKAFAHHGIDTVVLGCTHFAFLDTTIRRVAPDMTIIEPGETIARELLAHLGDAVAGGGTVRYLVTGKAEGFERRAKKLLG